MYYNIIYLVILQCAASFGAALLENDSAKLDANFKYYETPMTWNNARLYCQGKGGMLASPTSERNRDIMKYILKGVTNKVDIFIGVHSTFAAEYYNSLDGIPLAFMPLRHWIEFEPDNKQGTEKCVSMNSDGGIAYVKCDEMKPFICYEKQTIDICGTLYAEYQYDKRTNKCYKFHKEPKNYKEANMLCYSEGGHLAIVNSEDESQVIRDVFARYPEDKIPGDFWKGHAAIGFYYWGENSKWMTIHGQTIQEAGYAKFGAGEPNNQSNDEYCGSISRQGLLNDSPCGYKYAFICEKEPAIRFIFT